jgi:hypothetical protein
MSFGRRTAGQIPERPPASPRQPVQVDSEGPNPFELAEAGETVVVSLPESEQAHPVYGFGPVPPDSDEEPDSQE